MTKKPPTTDYYFKATGHLTVSIPDTDDPREDEYNAYQEALMHDFGELEDVEVDYDYDEEEELVQKIQATNPKDLFGMLTEEQRRKIWYMQEVEYIKEDIEQDFWRWGELEEIPEELEQALKDNAGFIYEYVEEEKDNLESGQYAEILKDAVKSAIREYNLLGTE